MTTTDDYSFGTTAEIFDAMTDEEAKEYIDSIEDERCIEEYKNMF